MKASLNKNILAQGYSQIVTFAIQLGTVPFLIAAWGVESYGVWLLLTAIPAYLALADFGFTFIAKNDMAMRAARNDKHGALVTYQSVFLLLICICIIFAAILFPSIFLLPLNEWLNLGKESIANVRWVLILQFSSVLIYQFFLLLCSGIRCEGLFATESTLAATGRLAEALIIVISALCGGGLVASAFGAFITRLVFLLGTGVWLRIKVKWLHLGFSNAEKERIRELVAPSMSYMLVPISNALMIQAPLIVLGIFTTPIAVALFSVTRTVSRLGMSGANMLAYAFTPEYSRAWGKGDKNHFLKILNIHKKLFLLGLIAYLAIAIPFSSKFVLLISKSHITPDFKLCLLMIVSVSFEMIWNSLFSPLVALNEHRRLPILFLFFSLIVIGLGVVFSTPVDLAMLILISQFMILVLLIKAFRNSVFFKEV